MEVFQLMGRTSTTRADEEEAVKLLQTVGLVSLTLHCNECRSVNKRLFHSGTS